MTDAVGFADIVAGTIIGAMANTMGLTNIMVGAIVGAVTYAMRLADIMVGAIVSAMANAMQAAFIVITTIIAAMPAVRASRATVAGMPTLAAVARAAVATVAAAVAAVTSAMAATTATTMATTTSAATVPTAAAVTASTSTMPTAAAVTAPSTAMATTAAMTASSTAMATTTIFRISAGEITDLVRNQRQRCRKSAANGERQQAFLEQHDESPLQGCSFTLETNATTNESRLPYGQPANQRVLHPGVCADVRMHIPSEASQPVLRGIFSHVSSIDLWYRESMTSYPLAIWPKPQPCCTTRKMKSNSDVCRADTGIMAGRPSRWMQSQ
ncbi:hypothetical protein [Pseudomonas sp. p1(2021b)]|uniref:hypothetical protein n=1 Tax=Pseudomonas sp. p1(2021b) TaxID=2874628 RepID=UPI00398D1075